jgi:SAM-dependent methyltransferase
MDPQLSLLFDAASRLFEGAGRYARHFARGKLRYDPVYFALLMRGVLPDAGVLLDLGCGHGILLALLAAAREQFQSGQWPAGWPPPPLRLGMQGFELREECVKTARLALGAKAQIDRRDIRQVELQPCAAVVMLDVLYHLSGPEQERLLEAAARVLQPGGVLLLREADAGAGLSFWLTQWIERFAGARQGRLWQKLRYRDARQWIALLEALHLSVGAEPMSRGTPFANVLFVARRRAMTCASE